MTREELERLVREVVIEVVAASSKSGVSRSDGSRSDGSRSDGFRSDDSRSDDSRSDTSRSGGKAGGRSLDARGSAPQSSASDRERAATPDRDRGSLPGSRLRPLPHPRNAAVLEHLVSLTPARIVQGRTGTRYLTESYLGLRADHAIAIDAVQSQIPDGWAAQQGWVPLRTRVKDHAEFLLYPDLGRRLDDASKQACATADQGVDVQLIAGDGLSAYALTQYGPALVSALQQSLGAAGFSLGKPLFVKFARIGVQDEIGVLTKAKCTVIIVGERPGLGTGDSLSIYTAFSPRLGQDNSEKDCISNVRELGFPPLRAAQRCADLLERTFAAGGGGVKLT